MPFFRAATLATLISLVPVSDAARASPVASIPNDNINNYMLMYFAQGACAHRFRVDEKHLETFFRFSVAPHWDANDPTQPQTDVHIADAYKAMGQEAFCSAVYDLFNLATGTRAPKAIRSL